MADRTSPTRLPLIHLQVKGSIKTLQVGTCLRSAGGRYACFCQLLRQTDKMFVHGYTGCKPRHDFVLKLCCALHFVLSVVLSLCCLAYDGHSKSCPCAFLAHINKTKLRVLHLFLNTYRTDKGHLQPCGGDLILRITVQLLTNCETE